MLNTMFIMTEPPVLLVKHEVPTFSCLKLVDSRGFVREGASRDAELYGDAKNVATSCFARQTGSASILSTAID